MTLLLISPLNQDDDGFLGGVGGGGGGGGQSSGVNGRGFIRRGAGPE